MDIPRPLPARAHRLAVGLVALVAFLLAAPAARAEATAPPAARAEATAPPAGAEPGDTPGGSNVVTFGVQPASASAPDDRNIFTFSATPGAHLSDHLAVRNYSHEPLTLTVRATDATNTPSGDFALLPETDAPGDIGTWVGIPDEYRTLTVPPRGYTIVPFELTVPAGAAPGDHAGGAVVTLESTAASPTGQSYRLLQAVGARIFVRVSGPVHPRLAIGDLRARYRGSSSPFGAGRVEVSYTVRDAGNTALGGRPTVWLSGPFGYRSATKTLPEVRLLLPGHAVHQQVNFEGVPPRGRLVAHVSVTPLVLPGSPDHPGPARASVSFWAVPWLVAPAVAGAALAAAAWLAARRRRRNRPLEPGEEGSGGGEPPGGPGGGGSPPAEEATPAGDLVGVEGAAAP